MSVNGDKKVEERDAKRRFQQRQSHSADYAAVDRNILIRALCSVSLAGGALRFGYSRDGNIFAVGVLGDGDAYTLWATSVEELDITLSDLAEHFEDIPPLRNGGGRAQKRG